MKYLSILTLFLVIFSFNTTAFSGGAQLDVNETDVAEDSAIFFFDLRERETFIQLTNVLSNQVFVHVQIFDVNNDCIENNFFDTYTGNDTHVYNMRDILTNDGNPSGVVLPENAYGFVIVLHVEGIGLPCIEGPPEVEDALIGNMRIIDNNGYEYRTTAQSESTNDESCEGIGYFNYNTLGDVTFSDVVGITFDDCTGNGEATTDLVDEYAIFDVDFFDLNEVPFSCRNVVFACVDQDNPRLTELLEEVNEDDGSANVANFEYGLNEAIPHSKGAPLLCPGNIITDGFVRMDLDRSASEGDDIVGYVGLNNGNGRGSFDSWWISSNEVDFDNNTDCAP